VEDFVWIFRSGIALHLFSLWVFLSIMPYVRTTVDMRQHATYPAKTRIRVDTELGLKVIRTLWPHLQYRPARVATASQRVDLPGCILGAGDSPLKVAYSTGLEQPLMPCVASARIAHYQRGRQHDLCRHGFGPSPYLLNPIHQEPCGALRQVHRRLPDRS